METNYSILRFDEVSPKRMDFKYNYYHKMNPDFFDMGTHVLGDCMELFNNPVRFVPDKEYKYYGSSTNAIDADGNFVEFEIISGSKPPSRAKQLLEKGTIVITNLEGNRSMPAVVTEEVAGSVLSSAFFMLKPKHNVSIEYLKLILHSNYVQKYLCEYCSVGLNVAVATWGIDDLLSIPIFLPTIEEQQQIISSIYRKLDTINDLILNLKCKIDDYSIRNLIDNELYKECMIKGSKDLVLNNTFTLIPNTEFLANRLDINYMIYKTSIELKQTDEVYVKLKEVVKINSNQSIKKGTVMFGRTIDFKDIVSFTGDIVYDEETTFKLDSDKTLFNNNDIMFSKFNPQFGKNVLVEENIRNYVVSAY